MEMRMAEVIRLGEWLARQPKRASEPCEARILLFTGVRYERLLTTAGDPPHKRPAAKRKKS
jgi:hypothetical protein